MNKRPDTEATEIPACNWAEKLCEVLAEHALDGDSPALHAMRDALEKTGVADALKDAERYRWLRDHWHNLCTATGIDTHGNYCVTEIFVGPGEHAPFADGTLEAAIDAAMNGANV